jgi:hypothetical protein
LVKGLRKAGACTLEEAQRYLERVYLPLWNRRFTVPPANSTDAHRPVGPQHDLASILSHVETRTVAQDYTIPFQGVRYQIARQAVVAGLRGARVRVEQRLDGQIAVRFRGQSLAGSVCQGKLPEPHKQPRMPTPKRPALARQQRWMDGFNLHSSKPLWSILRDEHQGGALAPDVLR